MAAIKYFALLRGINVGGNNIIRMSDLKVCFENMMFTDVTTYIQSGNVLFKSDEKDNPKLINKIEKALYKKFNCKLRIVIITHKQLKIIVGEAPIGFGNNADNYRYDVIFLKDPLTPNEAIKHIRTKAGIYNAYAGNRVLYFSRLISKGSQNQFLKTITRSAYHNMTIRNWNTTTKLLDLIQH